MVAVSKDIDKTINAVQGVHLYARVSSEDQQDRETIENQIEFGTKYCDLHKLHIEGWFKDDGVSGTIPLEQRPDGGRLIEDAKAGRVKTVLIFNMKRLGRKARVTLDAVYQLEQYGVKVKSMTEPFDTSDPVGRFIITVLAGQAELDRDTMLETLWHGANRAARLGKWLGGIVPFGYRKNDDGFIEVSEEPLPGKPDMTEPDVIRLMFDLIADQKWSSIKVADYFNALTIPPSYVRDGRKVRKGKRKEQTAGVWTPGRITNMIRSSTYKGIHIYGKRSTKDRELIEREVPAIVSEDQWERAQLVLTNNQIDSFKNATRNYLLRGLVRCGKCGLNYHGTKFRDKVYYVCNGKMAYRGPAQGKCESRNVPALWLEDYVWSKCVEFIENPGELIKELSAAMEVRKSSKEKFEEERQLIIKALNEKDEEKQEILALFRKKIITAADVEAQLQEMMYERVSLEQRIRDLEQQIVNEEGMLDKFDSAELLLAQMKQKLDNDPSFETKREIVKTLVNEILIDSKDPDGPDDDGGNDDGPRKPKSPVTVNVRFTFSNFKVDSRTPVRAINNLEIYIERRTSAPHQREVTGEPDETPGARLRHTRMLRNYSISYLGSIAGLSEQSIIVTELRNNIPNPQTLRKLANALKVPICYLGCFEILPEDTLANKIRKARLYMGYTKQEFAELIGSDAKSVRYWERGSRIPSDRFMPLIEESLQILS
jgi:site-specific DNA recombinase